MEEKLRKFIGNLVDDTSTFEVIESQGHHILQVEQNCTDCEVSETDIRTGAASKIAKSAAGLEASDDTENRNENFFEEQRELWRKFTKDGALDDEKEKKVGDEEKENATIARVTIVQSERMTEKEYDKKQGKKQNLGASDDTNNGKPGARSDKTKSRQTRLEKLKKFLEDHTETGNEAPEWFWDWKKQKGESQNGEESKAGP